MPISALCHVITRYKVKVARRKQQQTSVFSFFHLLPHRSAMQDNGIIALKNFRKRWKARKHDVIGTVSFGVSARESAPLWHHYAKATVSIDNGSTNLPCTQSYIYALFVGELWRYPGKPPLEIR